MATAWVRSEKWAQDERHEILKDMYVPDLAEEDLRSATCRDRRAELETTSFVRQPIISKKTRGGYSKSVCAMLFSHLRIVRISDETGM